MEKYKIGFVILHYLTIDETIECVNSIEKLIDTKNYEIVIVDNNSYNNTGQQLQTKYQNNPKINIILNKKNLGFSGGNNLGFSYAKKKLKCDFICVINNDTYLLENNFFQIILEEYQKSHFAVMGPEIHVPEGNIENITKNLISKKDLKKQLNKTRIQLIKNYLYLNTIESYIKNKAKKILKHESKRFVNIKEGRLENVVLHGCFWVFSPVYVKKFDGLNNKTFLYKEEELLFLRLKQNNMLSVYNPKLKIFHNKNSSLNKSSKNNHSRLNIVYKNNIKACKALLEEMEMVL